MNLSCFGKLLLIWMMTGAALTGQQTSLPVAGVVGIGFAAGENEGAQVHDPAGLGYVLTSRIEGGAVAAGDDGADWRIPSDSAFGLGRLEMALARTRLDGDLALILNASADADTRLALQLYDADGGALALDLFGNLVNRAEKAQTDIFIIPLSQYPTATRVVLRRLSGPVLIREVLLTPVVSPGKATGLDAEEALARALGERISSHHPDKQQTELKIHLIPSLEEINEIGAAALSAVGYPKFQAEMDFGSELCHAPVSGTVYDFALTANRYLSLAAGREVFDWFFTSTNGVQWFFENDPKQYNESLKRPAHTEFGMGSAPMDAAAKEAFERRTGYPLIEFPIARNAIEVIVHHTNPISEISLEGLSAAFGGDGAATWDKIHPTTPMGGTPIAAFGGDADWGTSRVFQQIVLNGAPWRPDMRSGYDVVYHHGVEKRVASDPEAIGYMVQRNRGSGVRKLAIEATDGNGATLATEQAIYSGRYPLQRKLYAYLAAPSLADASPEVRILVNLLLSDEGQTMLARTGSLPLAVEEVMEIRQRLGL